MEKINLLGVNVASLTGRQVLDKIDEFLAGRRPRLAVTVNPEMILAAAKDEEYLKILNQADLAVADGVGLKIAGWLKGVNLKRFAGADLLKHLLKLAERQGGKVMVFNWRQGLSTAEDINRSLKTLYPSLHFLAIETDRGQTSDGALNKAREFAPEIIFCTLGAPYQEKFLFNNLTELPSVKIALGVGGAFDFLTGKVSRAPRLMRLIGLEWLWRLIKQPKRWKRIYNAVIVFPFKFIRHYFEKYD